MQIERDFWRGRRVLVTGHSGFKGSWLSLWLQSLGAEVSGLAAGPPTRPSLYELARVGERIDEHAVDLRDAPAVLEALRAARPEVVLHLAAQPLVRRGHAQPRLTYEVNVMGTVNLLEAVRACAACVRAVVVVTSDKCYANPHGGSRRFVESDPLGGEDPYSSSKACAELVAAAYREAFFAAGTGAPALASARAGNVIGGGDWGEDRLLPDLIRSLQTGSPLRLRNPSAVRPWQHVLEPLSGYLLLAERLCSGADAARAWNFGPAAADERPVSWLVERARELSGGALRWEADPEPNPPEAGHLALDSGAAERLLGWRPTWGLEEALASVLEWHRAHRRGEDMRERTLEQIERHSPAGEAAARV